MFNRKYIFNPGPFSIAILVYRSVDPPCRSPFFLGGGSEFWTLSHFQFLSGKKLWRWFLRNLVHGLVLLWPTVCQARAECENPGQTCGRNHIFWYVKFVRVFWSWSIYSWAPHSPNMTKMASITTRVVGGWNKTLIYLETALKKF